jgi:hypothetical protein
VFLRVLRGKINYVYHQEVAMSTLSACALLAATLLSSGPKTELTSAQAEALWKDLGGSDAEKAFRAIGILTEHPKEAVTLLKKKLKPVPPADPKKLERLLAELGSGRFKVRQKAERELEEMGDLAAAALRKLLDSKPAIETQRRVERLLARLDGPITGEKMLSAFRGIEVLEHIGTPEARQVLEALASGAPGHRITEEARASLARLKKR